MCFYVSIYLHHPPLTVPTNIKYRYTLYILYNKKSLFFYSGFKVQGQSSYGVPGADRVAQGSNSSCLAKPGFKLPLFILKAQRTTGQDRVAQYIDQDLAAVMIGPILLLFCSVLLQLLFIYLRNKPNTIKNLKLDIHLKSLVSVWQFQKRLVSTNIQTKDSPSSKSTFL